MMRLKGKAGRQGSAYFAPLRLQTFGFLCQTPLMGSNHRLFAQAAERNARRLGARSFDWRMRFLRNLLALGAVMAPIGVFTIGSLTGGGVCRAEGGNPGHLEPISPYDPVGYGQAAFNTLIGRHAAEFWMLCMPVGHPVWAVILRSESERPKSEKPEHPKPEKPDRPKAERPEHPKADKPERPKLEEAEKRKPTARKGEGREEESRKDDAAAEPAGKQKWFVEIATTTQLISEGRKDAKDAKVERKRMEVDDAAAKALEEAWTAVTRQTRYAEAATEFVGVTYQFYSNGQYGETWSPATGLPAALIELGGRLLKCVQSSPENRPALLEEALSAAKEIKARADKTGASTSVKGAEGSGNPAK